MRLKNTILFMLFISMIVIVGCSKTLPKTPLEFQKELLAGSGTYLNTQRTWQLDSTRINGVNSVLTPVQRNYKKTFTFDSKYSDTDNNTGKWEISTLNKLKQTYVYQFSSKQDSITYDIVSINSAQMSLSIKLSNGQTAIYSFKISN
ncbi:MAG: hypothetical protein WCG90_03890 [Chitinophagia bacterium]